MSVKPEEYVFSIHPKDLAYLFWLSRDRGLSLSHTVDELIRDTMDNATHRGMIPLHVDHGVKVRLFMPLRFRQAVNAFLGDVPRRELHRYAYIRWAIRRARRKHIKETSPTAAMF